MKPILPKGSGITQMQGIFSSPRTTIILAPPAAAPPPSALPPGTPLSSSLILPAPPTFTITLAAHRVPQPTPVILPLTKTTAATSKVHVQCPLIAPKSLPSGIDLKDQQSSYICISGKGLKRQSQHKVRGNGRQSNKFSTFETPILPKRTQPDPQTVILLPSTSGKKMAALPPPVFIPKYSLVITDDTHPHTTMKDRKEIENEVKDSNEKEEFRLKVINKEKNIQNKHEQNMKSRNKTKADKLKLSKKKNVDPQGTTVKKTSQVILSDAHSKDVRQVSSSARGESASSTYLPESIILPEGYLNESGHFSHQQDVHHHPPPPYPQDSVAKEVSSGLLNIKADKGPDVKKFQKVIPEHATRDPKLLHTKRKKCEWKHKRHSVPSGLSSESSNICVPEKGLDSFSNINVVGDHHIPPSPSSSHPAGCIQPFLTSITSSSLSSNVTENTCVCNTATEASPCSSSPSSLHYCLSKNRNSSPSTCKSHTNPPHQLHPSFPISPSTPLNEAQTLLLTQGKSFQKKTCEYSYPLSTSPSVCVYSVPPSGFTSTNPVSPTTNCLQTSVVTHLSQSPVCSLPSLYSDTPEDSSSIPPSNGVLCDEPKSGASALSIQAKLECTHNTHHTNTNSFSHNLNVCDQTPSSTFYFQFPQCNSNLHSVLHNHSTNISTETNFVSSVPFSSHMPSQNQTTVHKVSSHSSSYTDSSQQSPYAQALQPTPYIESHQLTSCSQSPQPKLFTKPPHLPHMHSSQLPSYTQSSRSSYTRPTEAALNIMSNNSNSYVRSTSSAVHGQSPHTQYIQSPHSNICLNPEQHISYCQPTQSHPLCEESQHGKNDPDHNSPQGVSFSSGYTPSFHSSPQGPHTQHSQMPPVTVENLSAIAMFKDNPQSPILPLYAVPSEVPSSSQCHTDSSNVSFASEQTNTPHDSHHCNLGKFKPETSSSVDVSSHMIVERSLSPPSYEAHIQTTASYITSDRNSQVTQEDDSQHTHHQTSPANYSLSCQIVQNRGTQSLHEDAKKTVNFACSPSSSPLLPLPPPPRYTCNQHLTHEDPHINHSLIADIAQGTYDYDIEESSQTYFPSTTTDAPLPLPAESQPHSHPSNSAEYSAIHSHSDNHISIQVPSHGGQNSSSVHPRLLSSQSRVLLHPLGRQEALYKNGDHDDLLLSNWSGSTRNTGHSENLKVEKLWFIPHQEQNRVYAKESAKKLLNDPGLQSTKDVMLKKFWIEEDEPIAEEIVSSLPCKTQQQEQVVEDHQEEVTRPQSLPPQNPPLKKNKIRQMLCQICGKMLKGYNSLRSHLNSHHNIHPHSCPTCTKSFTNRSVLVEHLRIHSGETPYLCSICNAAFRTRSGLFKHGSTHTNARPFECSMCSKKFKTKLVLQQHMKLHLTGIFTCSDCGKTFERHKSLAVHKAFHHHKSQRFKCPHCSKGYHFRSLLNQHMQLHSEVQKHICSACGKSFVWRSGLAAHMKTHSTSRPKCDICDLRFASEKRLASHYQRHSNHKPHQCKICGRSFSHAYRLASHSLIHQENKEYICHKCDIVFTNAKKFRKHLVTHKKEELRIHKLSGNVEVPKPVL